MLTVYDLSVEERDAILATLNEDQYKFATETMKRGKRTHFARVMARQKGSPLPEDVSFEEIESLVDDWIYVNYMDMGSVQSHYKCECGHPLRYVHQVENKQTGLRLTFGINHLRDHLGIDAKIVGEIIKGFDAIDFELSEILYKRKSDWDVTRSLGPIPSGFDMPAEYRSHLELQLPLLDRQISRLKRLIRNYADEINAIKLPVPVLGAPAPSPNRSHLVLDDGEQAAFDLFGEELGSKVTTPEKLKNKVTQNGKALLLNERFQTHVRNCLKEGITSVRVICEVLIKSHGADDTRFSSEKPHIFIPVSVYLDELDSSGFCKRSNTSTLDRTYVWLGNESNN
jgi:hypothetical protein